MKDYGHEEFIEDIEILESMIKGIRISCNKEYIDDYYDLAQRLLKRVYDYRCNELMEKSKNEQV